MLVSTANFLGGNIARVVSRRVSISSLIRASHQSVQNPRKIVDVRPAIERPRVVEHANAKKVERSRRRFARVSDAYTRDGSDEALKQTLSALE